MREFREYKLDPFNKQDRLDYRYLKLAKETSSWSKDPSTQVGCVIVDIHGFVAGVGYNGFPKRVFETEARWSDRNVKYKLVVHAEPNAIISAKKDLTGSTAYVWPFMPCAPCAGMLVQAGIARVVAPSNPNPRWQEDFRLVEAILGEAGVTLSIIDWEEE